MNFILILGPPSAPGEPRIVDFDNKSVTLRWAKPKDTGGRPISHYIIQKKDKFGGWFDALVTDDHNCIATIDDLEARVPGLSEGKWYQFRVIAVNKAGESEPSPHTRPHLCRHKNRKTTNLASYELHNFRITITMRFFNISVPPSIDKGQAGSKTTKTNRTAVWEIKCRGGKRKKSCVESELVICDSVQNDIFIKHLFTLDTKHQVLMKCNAINELILLFKRKSHSCSLTADVLESIHFSDDICPLTLLLFLLNSSKQKNFV